MNKIYILLSTLISISLFGHSMENDSIHKTYWANGNVYEVLNYVNGRKAGIQEEYYRNGILRSKRFFKDGEYVNTLIANWDDGSPMYEMTLDDQGRITTYKLWQDGKVINDIKRELNKDTIIFNSDIWYHAESLLPTKIYKFSNYPPPGRLDKNRQGELFMNKGWYEFQEEYFDDGSGILEKSWMKIDNGYYHRGYYKSGEVFYEGTQRYKDIFKDSDQSSLKSFPNRLSSDYVNFVYSGTMDGIKVNYYDLQPLIEIFLQDLFNYNRNFNYPSELVKSLEKNKEKVFQNITATFETLEGTTIALSSGLVQDDKIIIKIDPENWQKASLEKRWYILYHELGHDVLNLEHGRGGKMMFNFVDRDYTLDEFIRDRDYMFKSFLGVEQ